MQIVRWAEAVPRGHSTEVRVEHAPGPIKMQHCEATGSPLVTNGNLGVDRIQVSAGKGFVPHTHPGDHILIVIGGLGTITYGGIVYPTQAGEVYMVPGLIPHAVGARTDHVILAVGAPHKAVDDPDRMAPIEYRDVISEEVGDMTCRACFEPVVAEFPVLLHELGCPHCPCFYCVHTGDLEEDRRLQTGLAAQRRLVEAGIADG